MDFKYDEHDAADITRIIRRRRPGWTFQGVMKQLQLAAERGASLGQVTTAAVKATGNTKATTPAAINWEENWTPEAATSQTAGNLMAPRLCVECTPARKHPVTDMTKMPHGWVCNNHQEEA